MILAQNYNTKKHFLKLEIKKFIIKCIMSPCKALRSRIFFYLLASYLNSMFTVRPKCKMPELIWNGRVGGGALVPYIDSIICDTKFELSHPLINMFIL